MPPLVQRFVAITLCLWGCLVARSVRAEQGPCPAGMLLVPGGHFIEGSERGFPDEVPLQGRDVAAFCLDRTEVTTAAYERCAREGRCERAGARAAWPELSPAETVDWSEFCNAGHADRADHPINCVTWSLADGYCRAQGLRLPTELEFEYAARGGDQERTYPWGEEPPDETRLNACGTECRPRIQSFHHDWGTLYDGSDGFVGTAPVGSFPRGRGRFGHDDLAGNVWEWTLDVYCPYGSDSCWSDERTVRGSGFLQISLLKARAHRRNHGVAWRASGDCGFRCAMSFGPSPVTRSTIASFQLESQPRGSAAWMVSLLVCGLLVGGAGWVLGYLGGGGSVIIVPIMVFAVGLNTDSTPVWTLAIVSATAAVSAAVHARASRVHFGAALALSPGAIAGAFAGGSIARDVPYPAVIVGFLLVLAATARAMLKPSSRRQDKRPLGRSSSAVRGGALVGASIAIGLTSGVLGIGSGLLSVPVLAFVAGLPMASAVGTSTLVIAVTASAALAPQVGYGHPDFALIAGFALASAAGTLVGARRTGQVAPERLRRSFGVLVLAAGVLSFVRQAIPAIGDYVRAHAHPELSGRKGG